MKLAWAAPALLVALMAGCAAEPFVRPPLPVLDHPDSRAMRDSWGRAVPDRFTADDTVIIHAPFRDDMVLLGVLHVDRSAGTFELAGMSEMGIELFHLGGDRQATTVRMAVPQLDHQREVLTAMGRDIVRAYLDLVPGGGAEAKVRATYVRFSEDRPEGTLVYELGGAPTVLLEKRLQNGWGTVWRIRYYDYFAAAGGLYPRGIVIDNSRYHYRIVVKNRDLTDQ